MEGARNHHAVAKRVKFLFLDGITVVPLLFTAPRPSLFMLQVSVGVALLLWVIDRKGMPLPMFMRYLRTLFVGRTRYIRPMWRHR